MAHLPLKNLDRLHFALISLAMVLTALFFMDPYRYHQAQHGWLVRVAQSHW